MSLQPIVLRLVGVGPMLMHSSRLADPLDPQTKALAAITSKRAKTDADHERISELEWHGGLWLYGGLPCLPPQAVKSVLVDGAKKVNRGTTARAAFLPDGPAMLEYDGPKSIPELWADERFRYRAMVRVNQSLTVRTRPCFPEWSATVSATFLSTMINRAQVIEFFRNAGPHGVGDFRPDFGRFVVEEVALE